MRKSKHTSNIHYSKKEKKTALFKDRARTNVFRESEQRLIFFLVQRIPTYISSDMLTFIGIFGSAIVLLGFLIAHFVNINYLLIGILGLGINWLGDSLDGRLAYYRNIPRKWYGFSLDIIMDWIGTALIGLGYLIYAKNSTEILAFLFVVLYGWAMIISQLRYKVTNQYTIDSGLVGPTELRVIISLILILEVVFQGSITYFVSVITIVLLVLNIADTRKLLKAGDLRDLEDKQLNKNG